MMANRDWWRGHCNKGERRRATAVGACGYRTWSAAAGCNRRRLGHSKWWSTSSCVEVKEANRFWKIKRLFRKILKKGCDKNGEFSDFESDLEQSNSVCGVCFFLLGLNLIGFLECCWGSASARH